MVVGTILVVLLFQLFNASTRAWKQGEDQAETYREARAVLQLMVRDLSQTIQPMTGSVYASPTPTPGVPLSVVAPGLVLDYYDGNKPTNGDQINEEVYCLTTIPNEGVSSLCAVGYFCQWKPDLYTDPTQQARAPRAYSLMRQYLGSGSSKTPGLFERFKNAGGAALGFHDVYGRDTTPSPTITEAASFIWDLQIRTPNGLQDATAAPLYPAQSTYTSTRYANVLPAYLEIRFKALSESAARQLEGNPSVGRDTWSSPSNSTYQKIILPGTRQFSARVLLQSGSSTATPAP